MSILLSRAELLVLLVPIGTACSSGGDDAGTTDRVREVSYELFPSTHQLSTSDIAAISRLDANGRLDFTSVPDTLSKLAVGDVILAGVSERTPSGLLRVVLEIEQDDANAMVLRTAAAPLQLAFRALHAKVADVATPFSKGGNFIGTDVSPLSLKPQFTIASDLGDRQHYQVVVFDGDGNTDTTNDQVLIDTTVGGGFRYALSIDMDWGAVKAIPETLKKCLTSAPDILVGKLPACDVAELLPELTLGFNVDPHLEAALAVSGAASVGYQKDFDVGTIALTPFAVGPLVFQPSADIVATISGNASASFSANAHANIEATTSVVLSSKSSNSKIVPFALKTVDADAETPQVDLYAEASAKVGVRLVLALYGVVGPYAQLSAGAGLLANPTVNPCWDLHVGIDCQLGVLVKTPSLPVIGAYTFLDWNTGPISLFEKSVVQGSCDMTPAGQHPPPGGGPSASALQKPSFTPWAKLLGLPADASDLESVLALPTGFPSLIPSVDGRYVASGAGARGLVKFDGEGTPIWRRNHIDDHGTTLGSVGSVPSRDAGLIALYRSIGFGTFVLTKQSQSGTLVHKVQVSFPDACGASTQALAADPAGGVLVVGECPLTRSAWLVRLDDDLNLTDSRTLNDADPSTIRLTPTTIVEQGNDWVIAGQLVRAGEAAGALGFFLRIGNNLEPSVGAAYACPAQLSFYPTAAVPSTAGNITLVGDASGLGYVARVKADGSLGFVSFPNLGGGIQTGFSPNAVAELPTTGLVLASTVSGEGDNPTDLILLGLDGNGQTLWGREYKLQGTTSLRAIGWPSVRLTDDGGLLVSATAGPDGPNDSGKGELMAMKVFARDGALPDASLVSNSPIVPKKSELLVEPRAFEPALLPLDVVLVRATGGAPESTQ